MKITLALLDNDEIYLDRVVSALNKRYPGEFEIYTFTAPDAAAQALSETKAEMLLVGSVFRDVDVSIFSPCGVAYLAEEKEEKIIGDCRAVFKYQRVDFIRRDIISAYADVCSNVTGKFFQVDGVKTLMFSSPCGGVGTSSLAAACAVSLAKENRVLYLNLEKFGCADSFFSAEGEAVMGDMIPTLKLGGDISQALKSCVKKDVSGVDFYSRYKLALEMQEISNADILHMLSELKLSGEYDYIIADTDFDITPEKIKLMHQADKVITVSDGSAISGEKLSRAWKSVIVLENDPDSRVIKNACLIYNRCEEAVPMQDIEITVAGTVPAFEYSTVQELTKKLSESDVFNAIV